jgi:hypothetical protein
MKPATRHRIEGAALCVVYVIARLCYWLARCFGGRRRYRRQVGKLAS